MRNFERKKGWRNIFESKPVLVILGIIILVFAWNIFGFWSKMEETAKNKAIAGNKVTDLEQQKAKLTADIGNLQTDEGKERIFRENYGLAKPGEDLIVIEDDKSAPPAPAPHSFFSFLFFWKNWFK